MEKLTDNEIVKALGCCLSSNDLIACWKCPAVKLDICCDGSSKISNGIINKVVDLINRQKAEIENLNIELQAMRGAANAYKAEVERMQENIQCVMAANVRLINQVGKAKAEAIKEFAERLKEEKCDMVSQRDYCGHLYEITGDDIDDLVKEMVGEEN